MGKYSWYLPFFLLPLCPFWFFSNLILCSSVQLLISHLLISPSKYSPFPLFSLLFVSLSYCFTSQHNSWFYFFLFYFIDANFPWFFSVPFRCTVCFPTFFSLLYRLIFYCLIYFYFCIDLSFIKMIFFHASLFLLIYFLFVSFIYSLSSSPTPSLSFSLNLYYIV